MILWAIKRMVPVNWDVRHEADPIVATYLLILDPNIKLVTLDYLMPKKFGLDVAEEAVLARPHLRGKIIVMSGIRFPKDVQERFDALGCVTLEKPFELEKLEQIVLSIIGVQQ